MVSASLFILFISKMALHHPIQIVPAAGIVDLEQTLLAQSEFTSVNSRVERGVTTAAGVGRGPPLATAQCSVEGRGGGVDERRGLLLALAAIR